MKKILLSLGFSMLLLAVQAQVSVVSIQLLPYNITPENLLAAMIMNNSTEKQVQMVSKLYGSNSELIMTVRSAPFMLKTGINSPFDGSRKVSGTEYTFSNQAEYIKTTHILPSGKFRICIDLILTGSPEPGDQFCDEIESEFNQYLYLVTPYDKDTVETMTPLLAWNHSEPFNVLAQGEYFRMIVSEINTDQNAEQAVTVNTPMLMKNYLNLHSVQYPFDAKELKEGKRYGWQVQKIVNGIITNKTEAWEFITRKITPPKDMKYVALQQSVDANYYTAVNGRVYFKFIEEYTTHGNIIAYIKPDKGKEFSVVISKDEKDPPPGIARIKATGDNRFVLDLDKEEAKPGFYTMKIRNEKKEIFYLKFYLPK